MLNTDLFITWIVIAFQKPPSSIFDLRLVDKNLIANPFFLKKETKIIISIINPDTIRSFGPSSCVTAIITNPTINKTIVANLGTSKLFTLSPKSPTIAGSRVTPAKTATNTTTIAPVPNAWKVFYGITNITTKAKTTVKPLNITAFPAVEPEFMTASIFSIPNSRSSLYLERINKQ